MAIKHDCIKITDLLSNIQALSHIDNGACVDFHEEYLKIYMEIKFSDFTRFLDVASDLRFESVPDYDEYSHERFFHITVTLTPSF